VREVVRLIETQGWRLVSTEGSHRQFKHPTKSGRVTVSGAVGDDMPKGTLASVKRQAGLKGRDEDAAVSRPDQSRSRK
jgi:predicted RNA binding protein YcfA (HicA-like mRNA interferase family)